jgi:SAM-dependent methyltransferase
MTDTFDHDPSLYRFQPSEWVTRHADLVSASGDVLDLACGQGRHSRFFLEQGFKVTAVDRDVSLLDAVGLPSDTYREALEVIELDLESSDLSSIAQCTWDAIVVTRYLHRPLLPLLHSMLRPGGVLIYETFAVGNERYGRPSNPDFLLRENELLEAYQPHLVIKAFEMVEFSKPRQSVVQRICAVKKATSSD